MSPYGGYSAGAFAKHAGGRGDVGVADGSHKVGDAGNLMWFGLESAHYDGMANVPLFTADCPRCGFPDVTMEVRGKSFAGTGSRGFSTFELLACCRKCGSSSIFVTQATAASSPSIEEFGQYFLNGHYDFSLLPPLIGASAKCPEHVPDEVNRIFQEAAKCLAMMCWDASGTMFRKAVDVATRGLLPPQPSPEDQSHPDYIAWKRRKDLRLRLDLLFDRGRLPSSLKDLASCIHEDGNDAAHSAVGIGEAEAKDLQDFTIDLLEVIYTAPGRIEDSRRRREARRGTTD